MRKFLKNLRPIYQNLVQNSVRGQRPFLDSKSMLIKLLRRSKMLSITKASQLRSKKSKSKSTKMTMKKQMTRMHDEPRPEGLKLNRHRYKFKNLWCHHDSDKQSWRRFVTESFKFGLNRNDKFNSFWRVINKLSTKNHILRLMDNLIK